MKKKFKGQVYRDAIKKLSEGSGFACHAIDAATDFESYEIVYRFSTLFVGGSKTGIWTFSVDSQGKKDPDYYKETELGRRTREIALELAAHLEETGEMDRILKGK